LPAPSSWRKPAEAYIWCGLGIHMRRRNAYSRKRRRQGISISRVGR
jgi:hypothetical protein